MTNESILRGYWTDSDDYLSVYRIAVDKDLVPVWKKPTYVAFVPPILWSVYCHGKCIAQVSELEGAD